ncbi:DUF6313 family protein [Kitasatospora sp. NPDC058201]|uniref:DUF6313 family protein n=1 Tax=unclassified Kitasatospora TaxID=2633591 RepID=UPI003668EC17
MPAPTPPPPPAPPPAAPPVPPQRPGPPAPSRARKLRDWWAQRHALGRLPYWLLTRASWVLALCVALFVLNGFLTGWVNAYNVMVGITSPAAVRPQWCAWLLAVTGWAAIPSFVGGMAGYLVTAQIQARQALPMEQVLDRVRELSMPAPPPPGGSNP